MMNLMETPRLLLRNIQEDDYPFLKTLLQDSDVMYAWEHVFSDDEVKSWIKENSIRYAKDGYGYWAVIEKSSSAVIGVCGLLAEHADGECQIGIGYIFNKAYWGNGYAVESARACIDYGFHVVKADEITAHIRPGNTSSRKVAEKLGMTITKQYNRIYRGKNMPHLVYSLPAGKKQPG